MTTWRESSYSDETGGHCIELAALPHAVAIRDSKAPDTGHLTLTPPAFSAFVRRVKRGELSR